MTHGQRRPCTVLIGPGRLDPARLRGVHALPGDEVRLRELLARRGPTYPGVHDWKRVVYAIRNTSSEQRQRAETGNLDIVFQRRGMDPVRLDHEELPVVRAMLDVLERGAERVFENTQDPTELQLWSMFRREALAVRWTTAAERAGAECEGRDLVVEDDRGRVVANVSAEELALMRESRGRTLDNLPQVTTTR